MSALEKVNATIEAYSRDAPDAMIRSIYVPEGEFLALLQEVDVKPWFANGHPVSITIAGVIIRREKPKSPMFEDACGRS